MEPSLAVGAAHHDVAAESAVLGRVVLQLLVGLSIVDDDAAVVGAHPEVAIAVLDNGVHIAQLDAAGIGAAHTVLVGTVLVRAYPYLAVLVLVEVLGRVVAQARRVELVVQELPILTASHVEGEEAVMVRSHPELSATVCQHVPHHQLLRNVLHTKGPQHVGQRLVPPLLLLEIDKGIAEVHHVDVALRVYVDAELLIGDAAIALHPRARPGNAAFLTVQTHHSPS